MALKSEVKNNKKDTQRIRYLYQSLLDLYGPQGWWPLAELPGRGYHPGLFDYPRNDAQIFEIGCGAVLTQNTSWRQAEKALRHMKDSGWLDMQNLARISQSILHAPPEAPEPPESPEAPKPPESSRFPEVSEPDLLKLQTCIRSAGYFRAKSATLVRWAVFFAGLKGRVPERGELLAIKGFGGETADCVLAYGYQKPIFVADLYSRRLFTALRWLPEKVSYEKTRLWVQQNSPENSEFLQELHALIVIEGKEKRYQLSVTSSG